MRPRQHKWLSLSLLFVPVLFLGCLEFLKKSDEPFSIKLHYDDTIYVGVPLKFYITFSEPIQNYNQINWQRGSAVFFKNRQQPIGKDSLSSDTVYLEWDEPPKRNNIVSDFMKFMDTISVQVGNIPSTKVPVEVVNVFPKLKQVIVNGIEDSVKTDTVFISCHNGAFINVTLKFTDALKESPIEAVWPDFLPGAQRLNVQGFNTVDYHFSDKAPTVNTDRLGPLTIHDGDGASRLKYCRFRTYQEKGSLWVGTANELLKLSEQGFKITSIDHNLDPNMLLAFRKNSLYWFNKSDGSVLKYNSLSFEKVPEFSVTPPSMPWAMEVDNQSFWEAHQDPLFQDSSVILKYSVINGQESINKLPRIPGRVLAMSLNTDMVDGLWYVSSHTNSVYLIGEGELKMEVENVVERPKFLSFDPIRDICWVANESEIAMVNTKGNIMGKISDLVKISSISAGWGICWVVDSFTKTVYKLDQSVTKVRTINDRSSHELAIQFEHPTTAEMVQDNPPSCWIADDGIGSVIRLDNTGREIARYTGLTAPNIIVINQGN